MNNLSNPNKPNDALITTSFQILFSNKLTPLDVHEMIFDDKDLKRQFIISPVLCRIGEYPTDKLECSSYDRFVTRFDRPFVFIDEIVEMDHCYLANVTIPSMYVDILEGYEEPVIHPVIIGDIKTMSGFKIAYFVLYDKSELLASNIYSGKWEDYHENK